MKGIFQKKFILFTITFEPSNGLYELYLFGTTTCEYCREHDHYVFGIIVSTHEQFLIQLFNKIFVVWEKKYES